MFTLNSGFQFGLPTFQGLKTRCELVIVLVDLFINLIELHFFFLGYWELNPGPYAGRSGTPLLSPAPPLATILDDVSHLLTFGKK